jgi:gliding motility-associated-like protein
MKTILTIVIFLFNLGGFSQYNWLDVSPVSASQLNEITFVNNFEGYTAGWGGLFHKTSDAGNSWSPLTSPTSGICVGLAFHDFNNGYFLESGSDIYKTTNGASSWTLAYSNPNYTGNGFGIDIAGNRVLVKRSSDVLYSDDFGNTWDSTLISVGLQGNFAFSSVLDGYACGNTTVAKTSDGGITWTNVLTDPTSQNIADIHAFSSSEAIIVCAGGEIYKTIDSGNSWVLISSGTAEALYKIEFGTGTHGVIVGTNNTILNTTDGGANWSPTSNSGASIFQTWLDAICLDESTAFVCGPSGKVYRSPLGYDIAEITYTGPDTVCAGVPFDFQFTFKNYGPSPVQNPEFEVLANSSTFLGTVISYSGSVNSGEVATYLQGSAILPLGLNTMSISATEGFVPSNNSLFFNIIAEAPLTTDITGSPYFCLGDSITLEASGGNSYYWPGLDVAGVQDPNNPIQIVYPIVNQSYEVAISQYYCVLYDSVQLFLDDNCDPIDSISINESYAFSPNNDDVNDYLVLDFVDLLSDQNAVTIYNRWGDVVFETSNYNNDDNYWDGTYANHPSPAGTYFLIAGTSNDGVVKTWVQIIR